MTAHDCPSMLAGNTVEMIESDLKQNLVKLPSPISERMHLLWLA